MGRVVQLVGAFVLAFALLFCTLAPGGEAKEDGRAILEGIQKYSFCVVQSIFSFLYPISYLPRNDTEFKALCKSQVEGFKCVKEGTKGSSPLIRRALVSYVNRRAKHNKKYCTNTTSEESRRFLEASKCLMERRFAAYRAVDAELAQTLKEVARRNYNDSAIELKQICCALYRFSRDFSKNSGSECQQHQTIVDELSRTIVSEEIAIVCDDEDKLAKQCAKVEPLQFVRQPNYQPNKSLPATAVAIYLIATLGEPNDDSVMLGL